MRKADFWTSLVLLAVAAGMLLETLSYPLEGSYAGVRNAWYVAPALLPLIIAGALIFLSGLLLAHAVRTGGAGAALADLPRASATRIFAATADFWIVGLVLAGYIYGLLPRVDFVAATTLLLFTLVAVYDLEIPGTARRALAIFLLTTLVVVALALFGWRPGPQSAAAYARDGAVWGAAAASIILVWLAALRDATASARFSRCFWLSLLTPLIVSVIFKFGLLVPLPTEGLTVELMNQIRYGEF
ncbi:MAG: hypothetical protein ACOC71_08260 [Hyphomicrobiales bacterium]